MSNIKPKNLKKTHKTSQTNKTHKINKKKYTKHVGKSKIKSIKSKTPKKTKKNSSTETPTEIKLDILGRATLILEKEPYHTRSVSISNEILFQEKISFPTFVTFKIIPINTDTLIEEISKKTLEPQSQITTNPSVLQLKIEPPTILRLFVEPEKKINETQESPTKAEFKILKPSYIQLIRQQQPRVSIEPPATPAPAPAPTTGILGSAVPTVQPPTIPAKAIVRPATDDDLYEEPATPTPAPVPAPAPPELTIPYSSNTITTQNELKYSSSGLYNIFKNTNKINDSFDVYIIFFCKEADKYIKNVQESLNVKLTHPIIDKINQTEEGSFDFYIGNKNFIFVNYSNKLDNCSADKCLNFALMIGKKINNKSQKYFVYLDSNILYNNAIISGIIQGYYKFTKYNNKSKETPKVMFYDDNGSNDNIYTIKNSIMANINQCEVRDLINEPFNRLTTITFVQHIKKHLSKFKNIKIKVYNQTQLRKMGMNLILAVNQGSTNPAMLVVIEYKNSNNKKEDNICLVGKGVMFDTGGINLKNGEISNMKADKSGGVTVYGIIKTLAELNIKKNVIGIIPIVQNDIGPNSYHPGDIIKSYSGKTVEIFNTDAEGRLILADAIHFCKHYNPRTIIDIGTFTITTSYGYNSYGPNTIPDRTNNLTKVFSNNPTLINKIETIGKDLNEKISKIEVTNEYIEGMLSDVADIKNSYKQLVLNEKYVSEVSKAAAFLMYFLPSQKIDWIHLDIGDNFINYTDTQTRYSGATGIMFKTLLTYVINN